MKDNKFNRRSFIKGVGTSIAGAYAIPIISAKAQNLPSELRDSIEGKIDLSIKINGIQYSRKIQPNTTLLEFLRDDLELTGTKLVCNHGECGGCTVLMNKKAVYACHLLALDANNSEIITIEGLEKEGEISKIQDAFIEKDGLQCGFCTPGQIISAYALLLENPKPTRSEIKLAMSGNLCRCSAYPKIIDSIEYASEKELEEK